MADFKRFSRSRSGGRDSHRSSRRDSGSFSRDERPARRSFRGDSERPEMFETTCDKCGKQCEVPFKPSGGKPVYCSDCFRKNESYEPRNSSPDMSEINRKLDKILELLKSN